MANIETVDLNLLKSLKVLIDERHVGRAAQRMNVTQSAMSQTLARLRNAFDDPLFVRTAKGLTPTAKVQELSGRLNVVLNEISELLASNDLEISKLTRRFTVHTHEFIAATYLARVLGELSKQAPGIVINIEIMGHDSYQKMDDGEVDLIVGRGLSAYPRLIQQRYLEERVVCLLESKHPVLENWTPDRIYRYPHIKSPLIGERDDTITEYGKKHGLPPRHIAMYVETLNLQPAMIQNTEMLAFVPESLAEMAVKHYGLKSLELPFEMPKLTIKGLWHERDQNDPAHSWFRQSIKDAITK